MTFLKTLLESKKTIFTTSDLYAFFPKSDKRNVDNLLYRAKKNGLLLNLRNGIWALPHYDPLELACKMKKTAYISCETVLFREAVIFQFYANTFSCISDDSRSYHIDERFFPYYKIRSKIRNNPIGIRTYDNYRIATPERALCDYIYLNPHGTIDAPESINKLRLQEILPIYPSKTALLVQKLLNVG